MIILKELPHQMRCSRLDLLREPALKNQMFLGTVVLIEAFLKKMYRAGRLSEPTLKNYSL